jgi:hypothetical protein
MSLPIRDERDDGVRPVIVVAGQGLAWRDRLDEKIRLLGKLRDDLDSCIGCRRPGCPVDAASPSPSRSTAPPRTRDQVMLSVQSMIT